MKWSFAAGLFFLILPSLSADAALPDSSAQRLLPLDGIWQFQWQQVIEPSPDTLFDPIQSASGTWEQIPVPGHWETAGYHSTDLGLPSAAVGIYRRTFALPPEWTGKRVFLQLEGALDRYRVTVNGSIVGENSNGVIAAQFDVTEALQKRAEHEIQIVVAKIQADTPWKDYSGLFRNVYLFAVGDAVVEEAAAITLIKDSGESAAFNAKIYLHKFAPDWSWSELSLSVQLNTPDGASHAQMEITYFELQEDRAAARVSLPVQKPQLWSAEQPVLYTLILELKRGGATLHRIERKVGLRQIEILKNSLYLNQKPVTLRGIDYWEHHPKGGMSLTSEPWQNDLELIKQAHINTLKISGPPPHPAFLRLCDRMGFYVLCDYPMSAYSSSSLPDATEDASWTTRYSLHPSLFAWNVPLRNTSYHQAVFQALKQSDPSHPIIGVVSSGTVRSIQPDALAFAADAISTMDDLKGIEKPMLAFMRNPLTLADFWTKVHHEANWFGVIAGSFVSLSEDRQGLVSDEREPGLMYWNTKRIYAPVQIDEETVRAKPGRQVIELNLRNGYDYTNMKEIGTRWKLLRDTETVQEEDMLLNLPPGQSMRVAFPLQLPEDFARHEYHLALSFWDPFSKTEMSHSVWLQPSDWQRQLVMRLKDLKFDPDFKVNTSIADTQIQHAYFSFHTLSATGEWFVAARERNIRLITQGPFIRLGWEREAAQLYSNFWMEKRNVEREGNAVEVQSRLMAVVPDATEAIFHTQLDLLCSGFGYVDVRCSIVPAEEPRRIRELGLGFLAPNTLTRLAWLGQGPYPSYPGLERLTWRGLFHLDLHGAYTPGNRRKVNMAVLTDERGSGLGIVALEGNVTWEPQPNGTMVTVNALVSNPLADEAANSARAMEATRPPEVVFRLIPWGPGQMPEVFRWITKGE